MKKIFIKMMAVVIVAAGMSGCEKGITEDIEDAAVAENGGGEGAETETAKTKKFTFTCKGDFGDAVFQYGNETRGYLYANTDVTDLWVYDYMGETLMQSVHQEKTSAGDAWGKPVMQLAYGSHHVYFVASAGDGAAVDTDAKTVRWSKVRDTFWKDYEVTVGSTSNGNRAVTLDRVVTKLKVTATDEVPAGCGSFSVTMGMWYDGLNYATGEPLEASSKTKQATVPNSYIGTTGQLYMTIFGLSGATEWSTDVTVTAKDKNDVVIGNATIEGAKFKRNRSTEYEGCLFGSNGTMTLSVTDSWDDAETGTW